MNNHNHNLISENTKTLCVVQITRIGDLLQTYQVCLELKEQRPDIRLILVARRKFAEPISFLLEEVFETIILLDHKQLLFDNYNKLNSLTNSVSKFKTFLNKINEESINVLVNLSFSKSASYLCSLIKSDHKLGLQYDLNNQLSIQDKWSQYIYSNVMGGNLNSFSLVDLFKTILGVEHKKNSSPKHKEVNHVVIHPFASLERKRWKSSKWSEVIYKLLKENSDIKISVVGSFEERAYSIQILNTPILKKYSSRIVDQTGKLSILELHNYISSAELFIGHDSMVGHLAAIQRVPSITISLGTVRPSETTPYMNGNYNIAPRRSCYPCFPTDECDYHKCQTDLSYQVVGSAIKQFITEGKITKNYIDKNNSCFHLGSMNIYKFEQTEANLFFTRELMHESETINSTFRLFYRICWNYVFSEVEENHALPIISENIHSQLLHHIKGMQYLYELNEFGKRYSKYILEEISSEDVQMQKINQHSNKINEIDELQKIVKTTYPLLSPIIDFFTIIKGNLYGENIVEISESSFLAHSDALNVINIIFELTEKTISEHVEHNKHSAVANCQAK